MPSDASLSRFGVLPDIIPRWYAPTLNQPTSSPMITRMLGFCPCWAEAGMLAIVVAVHSTTRAPQIVLNQLMIASLDVGCRNPGPQPSPLHRLADGEIGRSALDALCDFGNLARS